MQRMVAPDFVFPRGGAAGRTVDMCIGALEGRYTGISHERIVDFCVCQAYAVDGFGADYIPKWKVSHSFGRKALERFESTSGVRRGYEDRWLRSCGLSRGELLSYIADRSTHPHFRFIFPGWEEATKSRMLSTDVGYYICARSTLLWTPFSPACRRCLSAGACRERTSKIFPELYRIRVDEYQKGGGR